MKDFEAFREAIGMRESGNNYQCVNKFSFLGKYQFGKQRLYDLGYSIDSYFPKGLPMKTYLHRYDFLHNPQLQDSLFEKHVKLLSSAIMKNYDEYLDREIQGIPITLSGLVAGAHLKGLGGIGRFLKGEDNADALGTHVSEYIRKFAGYDLTA